MRREPGSRLVETRTLGAGTAAAGVGMVADLASATGGRAVQDRSFVVDRVGNAVSIADATITGGTGGTDSLRECFDYDGRSRLTRAWTTFTPMTTAATTESSDAACAAPVVAATSAGPGGYDTSYAYDRTGNTKSITQNTASPSTLSLAYPTATNAARPHAVTSTSGAATAAYAYHPTGEIATKTAGATSSTYAWTSLHELASTTVTTGASSATTRSQYGPGGTRTARIDPSGARTLFLPGMDLSAPSASGTASATRYYTFDGTTIAARTSTGLSWMSGYKAASVEFTITAAATPTVTQRRYTPYGGPRGTWTGTPTQIRTGQGTTGTPTLGRGFLGKTEDPTGLVQLDHRPYDPVLTRFLSVDPLLAINNPQTFNGYSYSGNNPTRFMDPSGLASMDTFVVGGSERPPPPAQPQQDVDDEPEVQIIQVVGPSGSPTKNPCLVVRCVYGSGNQVYISASVGSITLPAASMCDDPGAMCVQDSYPPIDTNMLIAVLSYYFGPQVAAAFTRGLTALSKPAAAVAAKSVDDVTNVLIAGPKQLQSKFKHAADFGVTGNYSKANAADFNAAIQQHLNAAGTQTIRGTYRGDAVTHFVDPQTGLNVISRDGAFVSGWRLNADQLSNVLRNGSLGGG